MQRPPGRSYRPDARPPTIHGAHQPGIATPQLERLAFGAFDLADAGALRAVLAAWSAEAERLMATQLTVTLGLGPGAFAGATRRPVGLRELPAFAGDALEPASCGGHLCVLACADDRAAAAGALARLAEAAGGAVSERWTLEGFLRGPPRARRDLLGFRGGVDIPRRGIDLDRHVWVGGRERAWMLGGTFLVVRRIRILLEAWKRLGTGEQERVIGRHKGSGAPLGRRRLYDPLPLDELPPDAHARLAAPQANAGATMLRRSYDYDDGLLFLAYAADPRRQYVPVQRRLAEHDALSPYTRHVGSAVFAIPPGARPGGFVGEGLFSPAPRADLRPPRRPVPGRPRR